VGDARVAGEKSSAPVSTSQGQNPFVGPVLDTLRGRRIQLSPDFVNLDNLVAVHFRTEDGTLYASVQPTGGAVREYQGADAGWLLKLLGELCCHEVGVDSGVGR
jgi:hypothetical protein